MNTVSVMESSDRGIRGRFFEAEDKGLITRAEESCESGCGRRDAWIQKQLEREG